MKIYLKLIVGFVFAALVFFRVGVRINKIKCDAMLFSNERDSCSTQIVASDDKKVVLRVVKLSKSFIIGNKIFLKYEYNDGDSPISRWGILFADLQSEQRVRVIKSSHFSANMDEFYYLDKASIDGKGLYSLLKKEYFGCTECNYRHEVYVGMSRLDGSILYWILPNGFKINQLMLYEK